MASDFFLKLTDIKGESKDDKHADEIQIESWSWGLSNSGTMAAGGGGGAGKSSFQDLHLVAVASEASPKIFLSCANGKHHAEAKLTCRKAGEEPVEYLIYTLKDVLISSYQTGGSNGSDLLPTDQFSLNYASIEVAYTGQDEKGKKTGATTTSWNLKKNAAK